MDADKKYVCKQCRKQPHIYILPPRPIDVEWIMESKIGCMDCGNTIHIAVPVDMGLTFTQNKDNYYTAREKAAQEWIDKHGIVLED